MLSRHQATYASRGHRVQGSLGRCSKKESTERQVDLQWLLRNKEYLRPRRKAGSMVPLSYVSIF